MSVSPLEEQTTVRSSNTGSTQTVVTQIKKRKRRRRTVLVVLLSLAVLLIAIVLVNSNKEKPVTVQTETISRRTITEEVQATGKIQPQVAVKVSPEVPGEVILLPVKEGDHVKSGQVLLNIKPNTYQDQLEQASSTLSSTKSRSLQSKATVINAKQELTRAKSLHTENLLSQQELDAAQAKYDVAVATEKAAEFDVSASESIVKQYSEALHKTTIYSPMEGVVTSLITQLGEKVVGTSQFPGTEMMTISDLSWMNAEVDVDENDVVNIKIGDTAMVTIDAFPNRVFIGQVIEVANSAKLKGNGTQDQSTDFRVKVKLSDFAGADLRPGMSCTAKIHTQTKTNVMAIPINAVTRRDNGDLKVDSTKKSEATTEAPIVVFVVGKDSRAKLTTIKTGISDNAYVEVLSGLQGDETIVKGNYSAVSKDLQDKMLVKVDNSTPAKSKDATTKS